MSLPTQRPAFRSVFVPAIFLILAANLAFGQTPTWPDLGPTFSASVQDLQKAAAKVTPEKFAEATVLLERDSYALQADGRVTYTHTMISRIETQAGVEDWAESSQRWDPWFQKQPEIHARVLQPDGKVSQLDQKTITDGPAREQDEDTYTDARIRKAPLPGLTIGAIVEEETVLEDKSPFFSGGGIYRNSFSRSVPVVHSELAITAPASLKLQYRVHSLPEIKVTDKEEAGLRHLLFAQDYLPARESSDIDLPTHIFLRPMVEFSTGESWASVASAYRQMSESQIDPATVKTLIPVSAGPDRMATIRAIVSRLHKEIRYTGIEFGEASLQPQPPAEVIKRHYGDCKDKAALLVSMLRAAGIQANLALLDSGPGPDVTPELPGMNQFDHAIVYLPADGKGSEPLWIDATAQYGQVGFLPSMDMGRQALIIAEGTGSLTSTPTPKPSDDQLIELRNVVMSEYGLAHITETSLTQGEIDADYRSQYGAGDNKKTKENLEKYARRHYLAKALTSIEHGEGLDLNKPFQLKLDMAEAKRGNTLIDDAAVAIPYTGLFDRLPNWFTTDPDPNGAKPTPQQEENQKKAADARVKEYDAHPFSSEWRYTITPPEGFILRALPENSTQALGPAKLTRQFSADDKGILTATIHFEVANTRYTQEEALALRDAILAEYKKDMILISFDQAGSKLAAAGKIREALEADRKLIQLHPKEALHHAQIAYIFLQAGMGDRARSEAEAATRLDPKSAVAFKSLGWVCQYNSIGIQYARGFDWKCANSAYKKALELDADDTNTALNLAILDEFDADGERYTAGAQLADAIKQYDAIKEKDKSVGEQYEDNRLYDLFYNRQYKGVLQAVEKLSSNNARDGLAIASMVAQQPDQSGVKAGIDRSNHLSSGTQGRSAALSSAGTLLLHLSRYPEAAEILAAAAEGQSNAAAITQQVSLYRQLTPWDHKYLPASDPRSTMQHLFMETIMGTLTGTRATELLSRHAYGSDADWKKNLDKLQETRGLLHTFSAQSGLPPNVLLDLIAGNLKLTSEGDDRTGYRITVQSLGSQAQHYFLSRENGAVKVVTEGNQPWEAGYQILYLLKSGREAEARSLLDWVRDRTHRGGGDDLLGGPLFPRFWTVGDTAHPDAMRLAAAALIIPQPGSSANLQDLFPEILKAQADAKADPAHVDLTLLLANLYADMQDGAHLQPLAAELLTRYPDSYTAIQLAGAAYKYQKNWTAWKKLLDDHLARHPDDEQLIRYKVMLADAMGDFASAKASLQQIIDKGKATTVEYNGLAWNSLFDGKVDADAIKAAQQASMLSKNAQFAELHTLACLYAVQGKTKEARDLLLKAMTSANLSEPNTEVWFGFGLIYEQYGINDAAIEAFRKVEKPDGPIDPTSTWILAQNHLKSLGAS